MAVIYFDRQKDSRMKLKVQGLLRWYVSVPIYSGFALLIRGTENAENNIFSITVFKDPFRANIMPPFLMVVIDWEGNDESTYLGKRVCRS